MVWVAYSIKEQIRITDMYTLFTAHYDCGYEFPGETHNFWECVYIQKGEVCVSGDDRVYNLAQGSLIFHKPLELHKFFVNGRDGADLLIFSFSAEGPLTAYLAEKVFDLSVSQRQIIADMLSFLQERTVASPVRANTWLEPFHTVPVYSQMLATYLQQLMLSLAEKGAVSSTATTPDVLLFRKAVNYLNSNISGQPSIPEIAYFCHISEAGIKRIFDKYAGIGIHKYLLRLKIKAAAELLQDGESVSTVAEKLGFHTQSYFSRAFKRETGISPSAFKQQPRRTAVWDDMA